MPTKAAVTPRRRAAASPRSRSTAAKSDAQTLATWPDENERNEMIAVAAYFHAERRGFAPGDPLHDWIMAEAEIARMFPR